MSTPSTTIPSTQESYTFTLTGTNITQTEQAKITGEICKMIEDSLNSKLEGFKTKLGNISDAVIKQTESDLMDKMKDVFIQSFNKKLDEFKQYIVENQKSDELMQQIIYELGIKFDAALAGNRDSGNAEDYAKFVEYMKEKEKKEKTAEGGRKTMRTKSKRKKQNKTKRKKQNKTKRKK